MYKNFFLLSYLLFFVGVFYAMNNEELLIVNCSRFKLEFKINEKKYHSDVYTADTIKHPGIYLIWFSHPDIIPTPYYVSNATTEIGIIGYKIDKLLQRPELIIKDTSKKIIKKTKECSND